MKKLPCGLQIFEKLINENCVYVDKTKYFIDLIENGWLYFLSRPRRFGKTLAIHTFKALFEGEKDLFKGLYAEKWINRPEFQPCPIIHLDMSKVVTNKELEVLEDSIGWIVLDIARINNIEIDKTFPPGIMLDNLILQLSEKSKNKKVVILVDEYDKPLTDLLQSDEKTITDLKDILRNFYIHINPTCRIFP